MSHGDVLNSIERFLNVEATVNNKSILCWLPVSSARVPEAFDWSKSVFPRTTEELVQAADFAEQVNKIPLPSSLRGASMRGLGWKQGAYLWDVYKELLSPTTVIFPKTPVDEAKRKTIEELESKLVTKTSEFDPYTGAAREVVTPSRLVTEYNRLKGEYEAAVQKRTDEFVDFISRPDDPAMVARWALGAPLRQGSFSDAFARFERVKKEYEQIQAELAALVGDTPAMVWQRARARLEQCMVEASPGRYFYPSYPSPPTVLQSKWVRFTWSSSDKAEASNSRESSSSFSGSGGFFIFRANYSTSSQSKDEMTQESLDVSEFSAEITSVPIVRPWLQEALLDATCWAFNPSVEGMRVFTKPKQLLSNGDRDHPEGSLPCYPTEVIMARDIKLKTKHSNDHLTKTFSQRSSSGGGSIGIFSLDLGGGFSTQSANRESRHNVRIQNETIEIEGIHILGYRCAILDQMPRPSFSLSEPTEMLETPKQCCGVQLPAGAKFCARCGKTVTPQPGNQPSQCSSCKTQLMVGARFCHKCRHPAA